MPFPAYVEQQFGAQSRVPLKFVHPGAAMNDHSKTDKENPYSPLWCVLLLLFAGMLVKTVAVTQLCHLAQSGCHLALN